MHLFGYLVHVADVRPLVWVGVDAHADQLPQLQHSTTGTGVNPLLLGGSGNLCPSSLPAEGNPGTGLSPVCVSHLQKSQEKSFPPNLH